MLLAFSFRIYSLHEWMEEHRKKENILTQPNSVCFLFCIFWHIQTKKKTYIIHHCELINVFICLFLHHFFFSFVSYKWKTKNKRRVYVKKRRRRRKRIKGVAYKWDKDMYIWKDVLIGWFFLFLYITFFPPLLFPLLFRLLLIDKIYRKQKNPTKSTKLNWEREKIKTMFCL